MNNNKDGKNHGGMFGIGQPNKDFSQYFIGNSYLNPLTTPLKFPSREGNTFVYKGFLTIFDLSRYHTRYQILVFRY